MYIIPNAFLAVTFKIVKPANLKRSFYKTKRPHKRSNLYQQRLLDAKDEFDHRLDGLVRMFESIRDVFSSWR